jgi:nicotinamidase-related amidase
MADAKKVKGMLLEKGDCVLVVIDVQDKLVPKIHDNERVQNNIVKLLRFCRIANIPVVWTEQKNLGDTVGPVRKEMPNQARPVHKLVFDCLGSADFVDALFRLKKETLLITGIEAHICVAQTALHATKGFNVHVVADAVSSRSPGDGKVALERMMAAGVTVTTTEMAMFELLREAGTDLFRAALPLLK